MRIALPNLSSGGRTAADSLHEIVRGIDAAAALALAPDLLALPLIAIHSRNRRAYAAQLVGFRETLADKAREWGVYVAFGLWCRGIESSQPRVGLIDPDGDGAAGDDLDGRAPPGFWQRYLPTPAGCVAVADPRRADASLFEGAPASYVMIVPCGTDHPTRLVSGPKAGGTVREPGRRFLVVARCATQDHGAASPGGAAYAAEGGRIELIVQSEAMCAILDVELDAPEVAVRGGHGGVAGPSGVEPNRPCAESGS